MANTQNGQFVWYEHLTKDPKAAINFYGEVVGWKTQPFAEGGDYLMWVGSQGPLGGLMTLPEEAAKMGAPSHWMGNVQVADVDATAALTKKLGGKVYKEAFDIPTVGRMAVLADPQGAAFAVFKPNSAMSTHAPKEGEFCWSELMTSDSGAAFEFYASILGWKIIQEMDMGPMGTYRIFGFAAEGIGGMMTTPKGAPMPPAWLHYTETADLDAAIARATKHGAKVLNGPMSVPGGARIAQLKDPQGAAFALHESPKKA
jgi:predicted enzyme related to lactoylglutathione lyase